MLERLAAYHDAIASRLAQAEAELHRGEQPDMAVLAKLRWQLVRELREYELFKHAALYDPQMASGDARRAALATELKAASVRMSDVFRDYVLRWSEVGAARQAAAYREAAFDMIGQLRAHLRAEFEGMAALLRLPPSPDRAPARACSSRG